MLRSRRHWMRTGFGAGAAFAGSSLFAPLEAMASRRPTGKPFATRSEVYGRAVMAATSQPLATMAALDLLREGGSAVDAAIAANAVLGLVEPTGCGIGGDLFAMVWRSEERKLYGLNGSGRSPRGLSLERLRTVLAERGHTAIPPFGGLPVSVPGCVDAWTTLHERFGTLPLTRVLSRAASLAEEGFPLTEVIAHYWSRNVEKLRKDFPRFAALYAPDGTPPRKGELFANPQLARTLREIGRRGRSAFYEGDVARAIVDNVRAEGGFLDLEDLRSHTSSWSRPQHVTFRGHRVWELPPNGQGLAALQQLAMLEGFDLEALAPDGVEWAHLFTETKKLAFADRAKWYADPEFAKIPVAELISPEYAAQRRALVSKSAARAVAPGEFQVGGADTVMLVTADARGDVVALIQSNFRGMGSGVVADGYGFALQDRGELFALQDGHNNVYAPGKRPFHTIIPAFVTKLGPAGAEPVAGFGVMGGDVQPQMHVQVLVNKLCFDMNWQEAGDAPRMFHEGDSSPMGATMRDGGTVFLEDGWPEKTRRELARRGHRLGGDSDAYGGYQAIARDVTRGSWIGASESRKDGMAAGW